MMLTTNHLAVLDQFDAREAVCCQVRPATRSDSASYRALEHAGLIERVHGKDNAYRLTADGWAARRLVGGMEMAGLLPARRLLPHGWHFLDGQVLAALKTAEPGSDCVASSAASLLLERGLASPLDEPGDLRARIALNVYGKTWRELVSRASAKNERNAVLVDHEMAAGAQPVMA